MDGREAQRQTDRQIELSAFLVVLAGLPANLGFAYEASNSGTGTLFGAPAIQYVIVAGILAFAAGLDLNVLLRRGVSGKQRIARHLWRMGLALFIAVGSLFLGQMQVFPEPIRRVEILAAPVFVVLATMAYWLVRILLTAWRPGTGVILATIESVRRD